MKKLITFIIKHKRAITVTTIVAVLFVGVRVSLAQVTWDLSDLSAWVISLVSDLTGVIINLLGKLIGFFVYYLVIAARYDGFATAPAINKGWVIMRDLGNLAIVISLLVIAFMTALNIKEYQIGKSLVNLVIVAIVINFSKTIALFFVDISQVVMLTFVNSFKDIGTGNLATILGIEKFFDAGNNPGVSVPSALAAMLFSVITMVLVLAVIIVMTITLVWRTIMIWFYIVLSPIAFAMIAVPSQKKHFDTWLKEFTQYLMVGPLLAFFLWLTFVSMQNASDFNKNVLGDNQADLIAKTGSTQQLGALGQADQLVGFILALGMLFAGLKFTSQLSGGAGALAGKLATKTEALGKAAGAAALKVAAAPVTYPARRIADTAKAYGSGMVKGVGERMYERGGLARMLTERGKKEQLERVAAGATTRFGGPAAKLAYEETLNKQAEEREKDLSRMGVMNNKGDFNAYIEQAIKKGDSSALRAAMKAGSKKGWVDQGTWDKVNKTEAFQKSFGAKEADGTENKAKVQFALDIQKNNRKEGNVIDTTDQYIDDQGNVATVMASGPDARAERLKKQLEDMDPAETKKMLDRKDVLSAPNAEEKVSHAAANSQVIGKISDDARERIRKDLESKRGNADYWDALTGDQKNEHEKLYEAVTADYDSEGRRKKSMEMVRVDKIKKDGTVETTYEPKSIESRGKSLESASGVSGNAAVKKAQDDIDAADVKIAEATDDDARVQAEKERAEAVYNHRVALTNQKKNQEGKEAERKRSVKIENGTQDGVTDIVRSTPLKAGLAFLGQAAGQAQAALGKGLEYAVYAPVVAPAAIVEGAARAVKAGVIGAANFTSDHVLITDEQKKVDEEAGTTQNTLNAFVTATGRLPTDPSAPADPAAMMEVARSFDELARQLPEFSQAIVAGLGERAGESSGQLDENDPGRVITNAEAVQRAMVNALEAVNAAKEDPTNVEKRVKAEQAVQNATLQFTVNSRSQVMKTSNLTMQSGSEVAKLGSMSKDLGKAKKSKDESAIDELIDRQIKFIEKDLVKRLKDGSANSDEIERLRAEIKQKKEYLRTQREQKMIPADRVAEMDRFVKSLENRLKAGTFYKLKTS